MENTLKIIETVGKQWPFFLILFVIIVFILKWKTIWDFVASISQIKIKRGDTEVELNKDNKVEVKKTDSNLENQKIEPSETETESIKAIEKDKDDDLNQQYFTVLKELKFDEAKSIFERILEKEPNEGERKKRILNNFYWRHMYGDTKSFDEFEEYITKIDGNNELKANINNISSLFYLDSGNSQKAIELLFNAINLTSVLEDKAFFASRLSTIYYDIGEKEKAIEILLEYLSLLNTRKSKFQLFRSISLFYKKEGEKFLESLAYQKALECQPNDISLLFDAAFTYSQVENKFKDVGLLLYKKMIAINPKHESALNNLGVAYKNLELPFKSVNYYKEALDVDSSIAASNLAYLLMDQGFEKEAEEYLINAQKKEDVHDNVFTAASSLKSRLSNENDKEEKVIAKAEKKFRFLNAFGDSAFSFEIIKLDNSTKWRYEEVEVKVDYEKDIINITWEKGEEKHKISGIQKRNSLELTYYKPKIKYYFQTNDKYEYIKYDGYGFIENRDSIKCIFEIEKDIQEFKFRR